MPRCRVRARSARPARVNGLPEVFDANERLWIQPDGAAADRLAEVVRRCPSGALQYELAGGDTKTPDRPTRITRTSAGQLVVRGELSLVTEEEPRTETRVALLRLRAQPAAAVLRPLGRLRPVTPAANATQPDPQEVLLPATAWS